MSTGVAGQDPARAREGGVAGYEELPGSGWVTFAGVLVAMAGVLNMVYGIAAVAKSSFYVANTRFVFSDLKTWGWIVLLIGAFQLIVAWGIWARQTWARWTGVAIASLNALAQLGFIAAYPWLSVAVFALDVMVIYGLTVHGGKAGLD